MENGRIAAAISTFIANHPATSFNVQHHAAALQKETAIFAPNLSTVAENLQWDELVSLI